MHQHNHLQNKVVIITGASRGIGRAAALACAEAGAAVVLAARNSDEINALAEEIKEQGGAALAIPTDVTNRSDVDSLITLTLRAFRKIDVLVNNAGVLQPIGKTWEVDPFAWERLIQINVVGPYLCARAALPHMLERGDGAIINVSSGAANSNVNGWGAYCASKAALNRFTGVLAVEVEHTKIAVSAFNPGPTDTQMQADIRQTNANTFPNRDRFQQLYDEGKLVPVEAPAQLIVWLASEFGQDQNGSILDLGDEALRRKVAGDLGVTL